MALGDRKDPAGPVVLHILESDPGPLVVPLTVATEVDHILGRRGGPRAREAFVEDIAAGRFRVECLTVDDWPALLAIQRRYADLGAGMADLSIVVLAARLGTIRILTFDRRDFTVLRPLTGEPAFELLPG